MSKQSRTNKPYESKSDVISTLKTRREQRRDNVKKSREEIRDTQISEKRDKRSLTVASLEQELKAPQLLFSDYSGNAVRMALLSSDVNQERDDIILACSPHYNEKTPIYFAAKSSNKEVSYTAEARVNSTVVSVPYIRTVRRTITDTKKFYSVKIIPNSFVSFFEKGASPIVDNAFSLGFIVEDLLKKGNLGGENYVEINFKVLHKSAVIGSYLIRVNYSQSNISKTSYAVFEGGQTFVESRDEFYLRSVAGYFYPGCSGSTSSSSSSASMDMSEEDSPTFKKPAPPKKKAEPKSKKNAPSAKKTGKKTALPKSVAVSDPPKRTPVPKTALQQSVSAVGKFSVENYFSEVANESDNSNFDFRFITAHSVVIMNIDLVLSLAQKFQTLQRSLNRRVNTGGGDFISRKLSDGRSVRFYYNSNSGHIVYVSFSS